MNPLDWLSEVSQERAPADQLPGHSRERGRRLSVKRLLLSIVVALLIIMVLFKITAVSPSLVLGTLCRVSPGIIVCGFLLHLLAYFLRGLRFRMLVHSKRVSIRSMFDIVAVHNLLNHTLPMRAGELSYVYLLRSREEVPLGEGLGTLVIARIADLMAFAVFLPLAILALYLKDFSFPPYVWKILLPMAPLFFLLTILLILLSFKGRAMLGMFRAIVTRMPFVSSRVAQLVLDEFEESVSSFEQLESRWLLLGTIAFSLAILGIICLTGYVLLAGMGHPMRFSLVIFCSTFAYLGMLLPVHGFFGFGTHEAGWTAGCMMAEFTQEMGVTSGFAFHIYVLIYATLIGLYGIIRVGVPSSEEEAAARSQLHT